MVRTDRRRTCRIQISTAGDHAADEAERVLTAAGFQVDRAPSGEIEVGDLRIDIAGHDVRCRGRSIHLTPTEFRVLAVLAEHAGLVVAPEILLERAWGSEYREDAGYLKPIISRLRRKLADDPRRPRVIETVRGFGYRLLSEPG